MLQWHRIYVSVWKEGDEVSKNNVDFFIHFIYHVYLVLRNEPLGVCGSDDWAEKGKKTERASQHTVNISICLGKLCAQFIYLMESTSF